MVEEKYTMFVTFRILLQICKLMLIMVLVLYILCCCCMFWSFVMGLQAFQINLNIYISVTNNSLKMSCMEMTSMETQCGLICLLGIFTKNKVMSMCYYDHNNCNDWHFYVIAMSICKSKLILLLLCNSHILLKIQCHPMQNQNQQTPFKILVAYKNLMCIINNPHGPLPPQHIVHQKKKWCKKS